MESIFKGSRDPDVNPTWDLSGLGAGNLVTAVKTDYSTDMNSPRTIFAALIWVVAAAIAPSAPLEAAERVALVIGNNAYAHLKKLENAKSDAKVVGETLKGLGFEVIALEDATVEQFYGGLEQLKTRAATAKLGLVYFAGHGMEIDGKNYLLPIDAELATPGQLRTQAVALDMLLADLSETKLQVKLAILDCCRDDPVSRGWMASRSSGRGGMAELKDAQLPASTMVMFSAGPGQTAADGLGGNSPFTAALVKRLRLPGQSMFDAFLGTSDDVAKATGKQEPWVKFDGAGRVFREMVLVPGEGGGPTPPVPVPAGSPLDRGAVGETYVAKLPGGVELTFCYCPPGTFTMGSPETEEGRSDDEDQVTVRITQGYWLARTETTQAQWRAVMGTDPSKFKGADLPVETVSWYDAQAFIGKLNAAGVMPVGWKWSLPTEAQWEYACRAGTKTAFSFGNSLNGREANVDGDIPYGTATKGPNLGKTSEVGSYAANPWGLHDMHGNVWEWCQDWYAEGLGGGGDPKGPLTGVYRVNRGGSWIHNAANGRAACRYGNVPGVRRINLGFRPALVPSR